MTTSIKRALVNYGFYIAVPLKIPVLCYVRTQAVYERSVCFMLTTPVQYDQSEVSITNLCDNSSLVILEFMTTTGRSLE